MKNFKIALFAVTVSLFASCDDAIDITQPSELLPENTFETVQDLELGLNGVYGNVPGENHIYFTSLFTDEVAIGISNGGQGMSGELAFQLNSNSGDAASIWVSHYQVINSANRLLEGAALVSVEPGSADEVNKNDILAQARALRAFAHFQLLTFFSADLKNDNSLGVIAVDFVPESNAQLPRNTTGEVFALIESDLAFADENLEQLSATAQLTDKYLIDRNTILALRARMAAYRGNYTAAKGYVDQLDAVYGLTNKANYSAIWLDQQGSATPSTATGPTAPPTGASEVIWALDRANNGGTGNWAQYWSSVNSTVFGSPFLEVNRALFNQVNILPDLPNGSAADVRKYVIVDISARDEGTILEDYMSVSEQEYVNGDILPVGKYPRSENQELLADVKVFRFSEMVLIRAEYYASIGDFTGVAAEINAIRFARHGNVSGNVGVPANAEAAWALILNERRIELAFEGHRYVDLRRLGSLAGGVGVQRDPRDCAFNGFCTLSSTDYRFVLPIPRSETTANNSIQQNTGY